MPEKPAVIKCPKCGYLPNMLGDICLECGARLEKTCGECGFGNQVEKNYCDQCGALLALTPPHKEDAAPPEQPEKNKPPKLEMESIQDTVNGKARSFRNRAGRQAKPAETTAQDAKKPPPPPHSGSSPVIPDSARLPQKTPVPVTAKTGLSKLFSGPAITVLLALILLVILYLIVSPSIPQMRLLMTAKSYLTYISQGKYEKAYELLSANSKASCSLEDYVKNSQDYYSKAPAWQFRDAEVFAINQDAAMVRYQLKEGNAVWKQDYISFVHEHNRWARPYIWVLFQPIEDAIKRQDFAQALFLAQKLYLTDPLDPRSSGYLCSTEFFMGIYDKAAESCRHTIDSAATYPVGYSNDELYWFNLCYADSLRYLQRDRVAIQEYEKLMKWPGLTPKELCPLFLNRADSYVNIKDYNNGLRDIMQAEGICFENPERNEAKKRLAYMSGSAGAEAVAFAQKSSFQPGMPPIAEARRQQLEALKARLGPQNAELLPKDQWLAVHLAGPEYRVFLRQESLNPHTRKHEIQDVFVFNVNLWTGKARAEKAPAAPPEETKAF